MRWLIDQRIGKVSRGADELAPEKIQGDYPPSEGARQRHVKAAKKQAKQDSSPLEVAQAVSVYLRRVLQALLERFQLLVELGRQLVPKLRQVLLDLRQLLAHELVVDGK